MRRDGRTWMFAIAGLASASVVTGLALSGCAASSAVSQVVDPVAHAAEVSELAPGFKVSVSDESSVVGSSRHFTSLGTGVFDSRRRRGFMDFQFSGEGHARVEVQYSGLDVYERLPPSTKMRATHGKPWIKFDIGRVDAAVGISVSALSGSGAASSDSSQMLSYLRAAGAWATRLGSELVRGVPTTHYRATIDYERYADRIAPLAQRAAARASVAALKRLMGSHTQVIDVWIDRTHHVRREELTYSECVPGGQGTVRNHVKMEYFDFAVQAMPALPSSGKVADVTNDFIKGLKRVKLGCRG